MKAVLLQHARALAVAAGKLLRAPFAAALNIIVFGVALSLPAGFYAALGSVQRFADDFDAKAELSLFVASNATANDINALEARLREHAAVARWQFVPRDRALAELKRRIGAADLADGLARNPLPDAFVIEAKSDDPRVLEALRAELGGWPRVDEVALDSDWAEKLAAALGFGKTATLILATLLSFALVAVTFNTIRLQILTLREEIEVSRLIGATDPFIRRPFLYYGALQGWVGGLAAIMIVAVVFGVLDEQIQTSPNLAAADLRLRGLNFDDSALLLLFAAGLGWLGARLSVAQHLALHS